MKLLTITFLSFLSLSSFAITSLPAQYAQYVKEMCEDYKLKPLVELAKNSSFSESSSGYGDVGCTTYRALGSARLKVSYCTSGDKEEFVLQSANRYARVFEGDCTANHKI